MAAKSDQVKGHAKETIGRVIGDEDLESQGKTDRQAAEAKEKFDDAKDKVEEVIGKAAGKVEDIVDKAKDAVDRK